MLDYLFLRELSWRPGEALVKRIDDYGLSHFGVLFKGLFDSPRLLVRTEQGQSTVGCHDLFKPGMRVHCLVETPKLINYDLVRLEEEEIIDLPFSENV